MAGYNGLLIAFLSLVCLALAACGGAIDQSPGRIPISSNSNLNRHSVKTWNDFKNENVVLQKKDFSCGAAALATLLTYSLNYPITEEKLLNDTLNRLNEEEKKNRALAGFTLLDLKRTAEAEGFRAVGIKAKLTDLPKISRPILVHVKVEEYQHFAVLRQVRGGRYFLADPSRGNLRMSEERFSSEWSGYAMLVLRPGEALKREDFFGEELNRHELLNVRELLTTRPPSSTFRPGVIAP